MPTFCTFSYFEISAISLTSITRPPSSLSEGRWYISDGVRLAQSPPMRQSTTEGRPEVKLLANEVKPR
jgi:hypothetical protein